MRVGDQLDLGAQHDERERAFRADQRAGDVEPVLGQQLRAACSPRPGAGCRGSGPGSGRRTRRAGRAARGRSRPGGRPRRRAAPARPRDVVADRHAQAVVGQDLQLVDVLLGLAGHLRVHAAGVVADHPAERAVGVRGRIGAERQAVRRRGGAQVVEHDARLDPRPAFLGVDLQHAVEVLRAVQHDRDVAALPGEASCRRRGPGSARRTGARSRPWRPRPPRCAGPPRRSAPGGSSTQSVA